jgi:DNA-binding protein YbaB
MRKTLIYTAVKLYNQFNQLQNKIEKTEEKLSQITCCLTPEETNEYVKLTTINKN